MQLPIQYHLHKCIGALSPGGEGEAGGGGGGGTGGWEKGRGGGEAIRLVLRVSPCIAHRL